MKTRRTKSLNAKTVKNRLLVSKAKARNKNRHGPSGNQKKVIANGLNGTVSKR